MWLYSIEQLFSCSAIWVSKLEHTQLRVPNLLYTDCLLWISSIFSQYYMVVGERIKLAVLLHWWMWFLAQSNEPWSCFSWDDLRCLFYSQPWNPHVSPIHLLFMDCFNVFIWIHLDIQPFYFYFASVPTILECAAGIEIKLNLMGLPAYLFSLSLPVECISLMDT